MPTNHTSVLSFLKHRASSLSRLTGAAFFKTRPQETARAGLLPSLPPRLHPAVCPRCVRRRRFHSFARCPFPDRCSALLLSAARPIAEFEATGLPDAGHVLAPESPKHEKPFPGPHEKEVPDSTAASIATDVDVDGRLPTAEERKSLRLVAAKLPLTAYMICLIELAERASCKCLARSCSPCLSFLTDPPPSRFSPRPTDFGCLGPFYNFIEQDLPAGGNGWGAPAKGDSQGTAGALGLGLQTATALTTLFTFLAYTIPIAGGIISDVKWGRYKTLWIGTLVGGAPTSGSTVSVSCCVASDAMIFPMQLSRTSSSSSLPSLLSSRAATASLPSSSPFSLLPPPRASSSRPSLRS